MGFADLVSETGLKALNSWLETRSYITGHTPSQADVTIYKSVSKAPDASKYPYAARWYRHIASHEDDFSNLHGDKSSDVSKYGPEATEEKESALPETAATKEAEDDDIDLFGSDEEEDAEAEKLKAQRLEEYRKKKEGKTKPAAKSIVTLDVKPWDDETDMKELEAHVRSIEKDGLVWAGGQLVAVGFGIKKLQINMVIEDDKVSVDELQQEIEAFEDYVQSTDVAAMQKL